MESYIFFIGFRKVNDIDRNVELYSDSGLYHIPITCCITRLTTVITPQQQPPSSIGFPPDLISLTTLLFRPIAAMAIMIKNLLSSLRGLKISEGTPIPKQSVVIIEARTKNTMNIGNALLKLKPLVVLPSFFASFACAR